MEYAEGETLSEVLQRKGTLTESELKQLLLPILDGLEAVHEADFLHRDIKPGNIVIRDDGSPVLIDFGSARQLVVGKSRSVTAIVTPGYAPIEQYSAKGHQGPWTDIYALGAVCYRCLAGEPPENVTERLREDPLVPASKRCKGKASKAFLEAIDLALQVDEGERPQSIKGWREVLADGGISGKHTIKSVHKPVTRSAKEPWVALGPRGGWEIVRKPVIWSAKHPAAARTAVSWSSLSLVLVIVVLLGASVWVGWHLYRGMPRDGARERITGAELKARVEEIMAERARASVGEMVSIPGGTFRMGDLSGEGDDSEKPAHMVTIKPFKLGKYEVTVGQFRRFAEATGYRTEAERNADGNQGCAIFHNLTSRFRPDTSWRNPGFSVEDNHPVVCVSWSDAQAFVGWLNSETDGKFRLPSEAEWEYAARAGSTTKYHFGNDESQLCRYSNHADASTGLISKNESCSDGVGERTAEVGLYRPNSFGLYDMHGNVWEWVEDCWSRELRRRLDGRSCLDRWGLQPARDSGRLLERCQAVFCRPRQDRPDVPLLLHRLPSGPGPVGRRCNTVSLTRASMSPL